MYGGNSGIEWNVFALEPGLFIVLVLGKIRNFCGT
jgi:hypothetical protein